MHKSDNLIQALTGNWRLALDPHNEGKAGGWFNRIRAEALAAPVPGIIQQVFPNRYGVAWYWLAFRPRLPVGHGRRLLRFGMVDYLAEVWLNGVFVGGHEDGESPFALDVTDALKPGTENLLAVRVLNPTLDRIDGMVLAETPHSGKSMAVRSGGVFNYGGIVMPVELAAVPSVRIEDLFVRADPGTGRVRALVAVRNVSAATASGRLGISLAPAFAGEVVVETGIAGDFAPGVSEHEINLSVARPRLWDLDDPFLYRADARLESAGAVHAASARFGFRDFRVVNGYFRLNGRRIFLRSTHTGDHYPIGQIVPPTPDFLRRDLLYAKASGFNMVRFLAGVAFPEQLDYCDEIGLMISESSRAAWCLGDSPKMAERYDRSLQGMIRRDRNHPSVTIWGLLNEMPDGPVFRHAAAFLPELRKLDDTRLVLLNGGRWDNDTSVGSLSNPGSGEWEYEWGLDAPGARAEPNASDCNNLKYVDHTGEVHLYPPAPHLPGILNFIRTLAGKTKPIFLSEFGMGSLFNAVEELKGYEQAGAAPNLADAEYIRVMRDKLLNDWKRFGMASAYPFPEDMFRDSYALCARQRRLGFDLVRSNPKLCGFNVTGMLDHGLTGEGLWTFWREWKPGMLDALRDGWAPLCWCLFIDPMHAYANRPFTVEAVLANEDVLTPGDYPATFRIFGPQGVVWEKRKMIEISECRCGLSSAAAQPEASPYHVGGGARRPAKPGGAGETPLAVPVLKTKVKLNLPPGEYTFAASLDRGGKAFGDRKDFQVSDPACFPALKGQIAFWGIAGNVRNWLERRGLRCRQFDGKRNGRREIIFVGDPTVLGNPDGKGRTEKEIRERWRDLLACVEQGGVAVFLGDFAPRKERLLGFLPDKIGLLREIGDWLYHKECVACRHPIFDGLQAPGVLDWDYYDQVISHRFFAAGEAPDETVLAAFAVGHSEPVGGYASGAMIGVYGIGRGRFVLNTLNVLDLVDRNPAADRLLVNFVRYAQAMAGKALAAGKKRFNKGAWAARYRPDPNSAYKRKWEISGPLHLCNKGGPAAPRAGISAESSVATERDGHLATEAEQTSGACPSPADIRDVPLPPAGLVWTPVTFPNDFVNFHQVHPGQGGIMYARGSLNASQACRLNVLLGSDGLCKLWIDGDEVGLVESAENPARPDLHAFPARLDAGEHEVVVALDRRGGNAWGFYFRLMRTDTEFTRDERTTMQACLPVVDA